MSEPATYLDQPVSAWLAALRDDDPLTRRLAAYAIAQIEPGDRAVIGTLQAAAGDPVSFVRVWAAAALAQVAPGNRLALEVLAECLRDPVYFVRSLAAWHLGRLGPDTFDAAETVPLLEPLQHDPDPSVRTEVSTALKRLRTTGPRAVPGRLSPG